MRVKYIGPTFGVASLTSGKIYTCTGSCLDGAALMIIDDSGEDYLYSAANPAPLDGSSVGGRWEVIEDDANGTLSGIVAAASSAISER